VTDQCLVQGLTPMSRSDPLQNYDRSNIISG
jgi:hypothetical protein